MRADVAVVIRLAAELEHGGAAIAFISGHRHGRQRERAVKPLNQFILH